MVLGVSEGVHGVSGWDPSSGDRGAADCWHG